MADIPLDLDVLLAPIDGDNPSGGNLREDASPDSPYYALKGRPVDRPFPGTVDGRWG